MQDRLLCSGLEVYFGALLQDYWPLRAAAYYAPIRREHIHMYDQYSAEMKNDIWVNLRQWNRNRREGYEDTEQFFEAAHVEQEQCGHFDFDDQKNEKCEQ